MRKILYTRLDGQLCVVHPAEGARLATALLAADGTELARSKTPIPADTFRRTWPVQGASCEWAETEEAFVARIAKKDVPEGLSFQVVDEAAVPKDRTFRNAWKVAGAGVGHDLVKCQSLTKVRLRTEREPKLRDLDMAYMRALEAGQPTADIVAQKQVLRDITAQVDGVTDLEALKAIRVL